MKIEYDTKYRDFADKEKYLTPESVAELKKKAEEEIGSMYDLYLGDFINCVKGDFSFLLRPGQTEDDMTVLQVYWCKRFVDFVPELTETLKKLQVPLSADEKRAADGLPQQDFSESLLIFTRNYFGLHSFATAEKITIGEIVIAKKDAYITGMFQRKLSAIQIAKMKGAKK